MLVVMLFAAFLNLSTPVLFLPCPALPPYVDEGGDALGGHQLLQVPDIPHHGATHQVGDDLVVVQAPLIVVLWGGNGVGVT